MLERLLSGLHPRSSSPSHELLTPSTDDPGGARNSELGEHADHRPELVDEVDTRAVEAGRAGSASNMRPHTRDVMTPERNAADGVLGSRPRAVDWSPDLSCQSGAPIDDFQSET